MNAKQICALLVGAVLLVSVCAAEENRLKRHFFLGGILGGRPPYYRYPFPNNPAPIPVNNPATGTNPGPAVGPPIGQPTGNQPTTTGNQPTTTGNQPAQGPVTINLTAQQAQLLRSILAFLLNGGAAPAGK
ncbi:uncharacterized protein LOC101847361 isoform X2 [Aplysia californica]|uniref:Uncharacterized protein LOC101847361 isoform X1 n=1 Tax=Aplysia californica TaxID=6500 RepID=A0ABM0K054_APLCA|nr:uncharacterized protein LOC101847361 isoform X1 [Aplysia californica]XP_005105638.1 uncharacterized protein LOC101847361 isoform X2 [Aplysia californica]